VEVAIDKEPLPQRAAFQLWRGARGTLSLTQVTVTQDGVASSPTLSSLEAFVHADLSVVRRDEFRRSGGSKS
jgi:hypothetical protein